MLSRDAGQGSKPQLLASHAAQGENNQHTNYHSVFHFQDSIQSITWETGFMLNDFAQL